MKTEFNFLSPLICVLVLAFGSPLRAAEFTDANWMSMGGIPGANGPVYAAVVDDSGNLYIGGTFTIVGDVFANNIAKWNGTNWSALGPGSAWNVYALALSGSNLFAGGLFTTPGGSADNYVAKWDGSTWSALGSGLNGYVVALAASGSDLYAGGFFTTAGGSPAIHLAKWDGSGWTALGPGLDDFVSALAVSGSDVYAAGGFTAAGGSPAIHVAKWDGSSWSSLGSGLGSAPIGYTPVSALAVSGSNVYAAGDFTTAGGSPARCIAKWDGSSWSALGSGVDAWTRQSPRVYALAVSGSDVYAGGYFTTAGGSAANNIAKWNGSSWWALGSGISSGLGNTNVGVSALAVSGSDLYVGGHFTTAGDKVSRNIARAYLLPFPALSIAQTGCAVTVSWPSADTTAFVLEQAGALAAPTSWTTNAVSITDDGVHKSVTLPATNGAQFFRLRRP